MSNHAHRKTEQYMYAVILRFKNLSKWDSN